MPWLDGSRRPPSDGSAFCSSERAVRIPPENFTVTSTSDAVPPTEPEERAKDPAGWSVYRQDDNGNRFLVESHLARPEADRIAAELESHGHKQLYWVERDTVA